VIENRLSRAEVNHRWIIRWSIWTMSYLGRREKVNKGRDTSSTRSPLDARWNVLSRGTL
jgi:hypothetical protein